MVTGEARPLTGEEDRLSSQQKRFRWYGRWVNEKTFIDLKRRELIRDIRWRRRRGLPPYNSGGETDHGAG